MKRRWWRWVGGVLGAAMLAAGISLAVAPDPVYRWWGWCGWGRYGNWDPLLEETGRQAAVDPLLLKALAWQGSDLEARFQGPFGEQGLIPLRPEQARDWAAAHRVETFMLSDLLEAETSVRAAAWILRRGLERWDWAADPEMWALVEFFAGAQATEEWGARAENAEALLKAAEEPIRVKVISVRQRRDFYRRHGW